jgi:predicted O-methyltransferase YrrM
VSVRRIFDRRSYVVAWKLARLHPAPWTSAARDPDYRLARDAIRHRAAQKIRELTPLVRLLRGRRLDAVLEIGTDLGGTLYLWCRLAEPDATIVSVDLPAAAFGRADAEAVEPTLRSYACANQALHLLRADSHELSTRQRVGEVLGERPVDLLFVDGDHSYEGVKADFELYAPLVREGGLIVLHDILPNEIASNCEVDRLWSELRPHYSVIEFADPFDDRGRGQWGGIGVIHWAAGASAAPA